MSFTMFTCPAPPPPEEMEPTEYSTALKHVVAKYLGAGDGSLRVGPTRLEKTDSLLRAFLTGIVLAGTPSLSAEATELLRLLDASEYGLILWIGNIDDERS